MSPQLDVDTARSLFGSVSGLASGAVAASVARFASVRPDGSPHVVPVTFALVGEAIVFAVDAKPKSTLQLQRLANVAAEPRVSFLVDEYEDDWDALWWARADGVARVLAADSALEAERRGLALAALGAKYPQYRVSPPVGPVVWTDVTRWSGWSAR